MCDSAAVIPNQKHGTRITFEKAEDQDTNQAERLKSDVIRFIRLFRVPLASISGFHHYITYDS